MNERPWACVASGGLTTRRSPPFAGWDSAPARPEEEVGFVSAAGATRPRIGGLNAGGHDAPWRAQAQCGEQHAPRNPGTRRGGSPLPPPATAARASQQRPAAERRGPTLPQRVATTSFPYRPPSPAAEEHRPLRTDRGSGLSRRHPANAPQLAPRRRRNGSCGDDGGAGSVRVRRRRKRAWRRGRPAGGAEPEHPVAWEIRAPRGSLPELRRPLLNVLGSWGPVPF